MNYEGRIGTVLKQSGTEPCRSLLTVSARQDYSRSYHQSRQRQATQNTDLIAAFTMDLLTI